jgi:hypothetical protein
MRRVALVFGLAQLALAACQSSDVSRGLGARCNVNSECDQRCLTGAGWPDGFCTTICDTDANCPSDAACIDDSGGVCAFVCRTNVDCAFLGPTYTCQPHDAHPIGMKVMVCAGG